MLRGYVRLERPGGMSGSQIGLVGVDRNYDYSRINSSPRVNRSLTRTGNKHLKNVLKYFSKIGAHAMDSLLNSLKQ